MSAGVLTASGVCGGDDSTQLPFARRAAGGALWGLTEEEQVAARKAPPRRGRRRACEHTAVGLVHVLAGSAEAPRAVFASRELTRGAEP